MPINNQTIIESIRALAKARGVSIAQMLKECNINPNFIYDLEHKNASPSVDKIARIAEYFGVSTARIIEGESGEVAALLALYEKLSPASKAELRDYIASLIQP